MPALVSIGYDNTDMFENASEVDSSKIPGLYGNKASHRPKKVRGKTAPDRYSNALDQNDRHQS
jgi:hypothetical protein